MPPAPRQIAALAVLLLSMLAGGCGDGTPGQAEGVEEERYRHYLRFVEE